MIYKGYLGALPASNVSTLEQLAWVQLESITSTCFNLLYLENGAKLPFIC